jgi:broad specificity phosphatase PhoE
MTRLYLVRHGRATGGWDVDPDPGLDELGQEQARAVADRLAPLGPLAVLSSPMRRCQETSAPLAGRWGASVAIEPAVTEIPSPDGYALNERIEWLRNAMEGQWAALGPYYTGFRDSIADRLVRCPVDTVVFSHYIAINAAIGAAIGDDRLVIRALDNCSVTVLDVVNGRLKFVEGGHEADTLIR